MSTNGTGSVFGRREIQAKPHSKANQVAREYIWLKCDSCNQRNYRVEKEMRGTERLELKKYCRHERQHTTHKEDRKK